MHSDRQSVPAKPADDGTPPARVLRDAHVARPRERLPRNRRIRLLGSWGPSDLRCRVYIPGRGYLIAQVAERRRAELIERRSVDWFQTAPGLSRDDPSKWGAAAGPASRPFRSEWERRLADALTSLGVRWEYEPRRFRYRDWANSVRSYLPDFQLVDFTDTFVEVKGYRGADAADAVKMRWVVAGHPQLTLLLWGPVTIEMIEDADDPAMILGLLRTTRFPA